MKRQVKPNDAVAEAIDKNFDKIMAELERRHTIELASPAVCAKCGWYLTYTAQTTYKACPYCGTPFETVNR